MAAGGHFACAVVAGGGVTCWGDDSVGQLGDGKSGARNVLPVAVVGLTDVVKVACAEGHTCAQKRDHSIWCWGAGDLGDGKTTSSLVPVQAVAPCP